MSLLLALTIGCASGPYGAPADSTITLLTENEEIVFDVAYQQAGDGLGLLVRETALVMVPGTNGSSDGGNDILVEITSGWTGAYVIPESAVSVVDAYADGCDGDASEECADWFDIGTDQYIEFSGDYQDLGGFRPTYMSGATDNRGLLDFYVFIDSLPIDDEGAVIEIPMYGSIGVDVISWSYGTGE